MKNPGGANGADGGENGGGKPRQRRATVRSGKRSLTTIADPVEGLAPLDELPASERVFLTDGDIRVPVRRISGRRRRAAGRRLRPGRAARRPICTQGCRSCGSPGSIGGSHAATRTAARCTTRAAARSPRRCGSVALREGVTPEFVRDEVARGRAIIPGEPQPSRVRADDHRPQLPGEDQRQHRQLGGVVVDRRGGRQAALVGALGRRHRDGPVDRATTSTRRASGSSATRRCRSARCRSTRRWRR